MRLAWMRQDLGSARRATTFLLVLLVGSTLVNLILATFAVRVSGRERIVVVPPSVHKTFWVEADRVSPEYLEEMGYFLMQLILNVTPQSVDHQELFTRRGSRGKQGGVNCKPFCKQGQFMPVVTSSSYPGSPCQVTEKKKQENCNRMGGMVALGLRGAEKARTDSGTIGHTRVTSKPV